MDNTTTATTATTTTMKDLSNTTRSQDNEEELEDLDLNKEPFYFESDSLALRNNSDYSCLLKTFILLEGQRIQAIQDLEKLIDLKEQAMREPVKFIDQLLKSSSAEQTESMKTQAHEANLLNEMPSRQKVYCLPDINWNKYYDCVDIEDLEAIKNQNLKHNLRESNKSTRNSTRIQINQIQQQEQHQHTSDSSRSKQRRNTSDTDNKTPANYNKSWSVDEQRRLEDLLIEFPPEDNEAARWRKIANKLGTRTPLQVQSHCQKYFIKLAKAGLPIPGRMPNLKTYVVRKGNRGNRRSSLMRGACMSVGAACTSTTAGIGGGRLNNRNGVASRRMVGRGSSLNEISSMWTSFNPPITMNDEQNDEDEDDNDDDAEQSQYEEADYFYEDQEEDDGENDFEDYEQENEEEQV